MYLLQTSSRDSTQFQSTSWLTCSISSHTLYPIPFLPFINKKINFLPQHMVPLFIYVMAQITCTVPPIYWFCWFTQSSCIPAYIPTAIEYLLFFTIVFYRQLLSPTALPMPLSKNFPPSCFACHVINVKFLLPLATRTFIFQQF